MAPITGPLKGLIWVAKKIQASAEQEITAKREATRAELSSLYMMMDTGKITEEEFDKREHELLDQLDKLDNIK